MAGPRRPQPRAYRSLRSNGAGDAGRRPGHHHRLRCRIRIAPWCLAPPMVGSRAFEPSTMLSEGVVMAIRNGQPPTASAPTRRRDDPMHARFAAILRSSADAIVVETLEGIVTEWNPAAERLYGYAAGEVIGQHLSMVIPAERMEEAEAILDRVRRGDSVEGVETVRRTKDGRTIEVALTISPVWDDAGTLIATSAIVRDITERRQLERELQASERRYRALVEQLPAVIYVQANDERQTSTYFNPQFAALTGYTMAEIMDQPPEE